MKYLKRSKAEKKIRRKRNIFRETMSIIFIKDNNQRLGYFHHEKAGAR